MGKIYYNGLTESLIVLSRNISVKADLWPLIRFGMAVMYNRGKSIWPIASVFIRTLVNDKPESVQITMERVARVCRLEKYTEIVPD